jgi:hypothetical protein
MRRGILWSGVLLVSGALVVAGVPGLARRLQLITLEGCAVAQPWLDTPAALATLIGAATFLVTWSGIALVAHLRDPRRRVRRLARPGRSLAELARATRLPQDAVRDLLAREAGITGRTGSPCRSDEPAFAGLLEDNIRHDNELSAAARRPIARHAACPSGSRRIVPAFQTVRQNA